MSPSPPQLTAELEAKLLARLAVEWRGLNTRYFRSALRIPVIELVDAAPTRDLARWIPDLRSLEIARVAILEHPWVDVLEALKRELVQQYVDELLAVDERRHGRCFRRICRRFGVRLHVAPGPAQSPADPSARVLARIHKLLALARSPNRHEAETAATLARQLMLEFNLEWAAPAEHDALDTRGYGFRHLGRPRGRLREHDRRLAKILNGYFFVESAWVPVYLPREGRRGSVLEICGLEANLRMAEHVHDFLERTAARLWLEYAGAREAASGQDRLAFLAGVMTGFETKLAQQDQVLEERGLVWVPAPELDVYFRRRNPGVMVVPGGGGARSAAYEHGSRAGQAIVLSRPLASTRPAGPPKALKAGS